MCDGHSISVHPGWVVYYSLPSCPFKKGRVPAGVLDLGLPCGGKIRAVVVPPRTDPDATVRGSGERRPSETERFFIECPEKRDSLDACPVFKALRNAVRECASPEVLDPDARPVLREEADLGDLDRVPADVRDDNGEGQSAGDCGGPCVNGDVGAVAPELAEEREAGNGERENGENERGGVHAPGV